MKIADDIERRRARFVPCRLTAGTQHLPASERDCLSILAEAGEVVNRIFRKQAWASHETVTPKVARLDGPLADAARDYYRIMAGPWDRLDEFEPFLGQTPRPPGAGFYPEDLTVEEFEAYLETHPGDRKALTGLYTLVERRGGGLVPVPYSEAFRPELQELSRALSTASNLTENVSLRRFLERRAEGFGQDDYYESDLAWMDLDSPVEIVVGPYEAYEDTLFGYKAAFELFLCVAQPEDSAALERFNTELPWMEDHLPIPDPFKNASRGTDSPIRVVDVLLTAGDARAGVQTLAFNLPNDERVREAKGSKKVLLKNIMHAKYDRILQPVAERVLPAQEVKRLDFDAYFHHILLHELSHGLGPGRIRVNGRETEVRLELKEHYSALEEAKADAVGMHNLYLLAERGLVPGKVIDGLPWTYTAGLFRAARFGLREAHGLAVVLQANYLEEAGALTVTPEGRFRPVPERFRDAARRLSAEILTLEARGVYDDAALFLARYGTAGPAFQRGLASLRDLPVDVDPVYASVEE